MTGRSNGPHLHLTLQQADAVFGNYPQNIIDPTPFLAALQNANGSDAAPNQGARSQSTRSQSTRSQSTRSQSTRSQSTRSIAGFDFQGYNQQFTSNTTGALINRAAQYNVGVHPATVATGETYWQVVGIHHLTPEENRSRHNIFVDVLDEQGQRIRDTQVGWNWEGNGDTPTPRRLDKPANEPGCDIPLFDGSFKLWVMGAPSDEAFGFHYRHADEPAANGELLNTFGHHSFYVVFQRTRKGTVQPVDNDHDVVITPPIKPIDVDPVVGVKLGSGKLRAAAKIGIDANAPIDESSGRISDQVNDPSLIAGVGVGWVRLNFIIGPWQDPHDPQRPFGKSWRETYQRIIDGFVQQGLQIYGLISDQALREKPGGRLRSAPDGDLRRDGWVQSYVDTFVTIAHLFGDKVTLFESFNEPDDWKHGEQPGWSDANPNWIHPGWFATILQAVYDAVRSDPGLRHIRLISGPLQGMDNNGNAGAGYLRRTYVEGKARYGWGQPSVPFPFDGVGYHLYIAEGERENVGQRLRAKYDDYMNGLRAVIQTEEGAHKPIFISEIGWENPGDRDHLQQEAMHSAFDAILADPSVALGIWFCMQDFPGKPYGLYRQDGLNQAQRKAVHDRLFAICNQEREVTTLASVFAAVDTPIIAPRPVDGAKYVPGKDLIVDWTVIQPGQPFTQRWTMRNSGQTVWSSGYKLVWVADESMGAPPQVSVPACAPGQEVAISVSFLAPTSSGGHKSTWRLCNDRDELFGDPIWVEIQVAATRELAPLTLAPAPQTTALATALDGLVQTGVAGTQQILARLHAGLAATPPVPLTETLTLAALGVAYHAYWTQIAGLRDEADRTIIGKEAADRAFNRINTLLGYEQTRGGGVVAPTSLPSTLPTAIPSFSSSTLPSLGQSSGGHKRALCIGIDNYAQQPLTGCVADARRWAETLIARGFESPRLLLNQEATRNAILSAIQHLLADSQPGDILVIQYAGHGTQLDDVSGDERGGDTPEKDEALVPFDFLSGAYVLDDDLGALFTGIPAGVNVTCFMDCCHSGSLTRDMLRPDEHARFIVADGAMIEAHRRYRESLGASRSVGKRELESMREVVFSACQSLEVAWESAGNGEFTLHATNLLKAGASALSHDDFIQQVITAFGATPRQNPLVECATAARSRLLLAAIMA